MHNNLYFLTNIKEYCVGSFVDDTATAKTQRIKFYNVNNVSTFKEK